MTQHMPNYLASRLNVIVMDRNREWRRLATLCFTKTDNSIYLLPVGPSSRYRMQAFDLPGGDEQGTFSYDEAANLDSSPKISIHASGAVHGTLGADHRTVDRQLPELHLLRGQHVATVTTSSVTALRPYGRSPRQSSGSTQDLPMRALDSDSCRLAVFVNGVEPKYVNPCQWSFHLKRGDARPPINVGICGLHQEPLAGEGDAVIAISGWDPTAPDVDPMTGVAVIGTS